jgi:hypothetical protein
MSNPLPPFPLPPPALPPPITTYRSPKVLATAARGLLLVFILLAGVDAAANAAMARMGSRIEADANLVGVAQLEAAERRLTVTAVVLLVAFLAALGFLIAWTSRAYRNLPALGAAHLRFTQGWAVGSWFVPFLNFVRPKQILDDIWRVSCGEDGVADWHGRRVSPLLHLWWGLWIFGGLLGLTMPDSANLSSLQRAAVTGCVADGILIVACALAIVVITRATEGQELRATGDAPERSSTWEHAVWAGPTLAMALFAALFTGFANIDDDSASDGRPSESSRASDDDGRRSVLAMNLELGDCFDKPRGWSDSPDGVSTILAFNVLPCTEAHDGEVVGEVRHAADPDAPYPGDDALIADAEAPCLEHFEEWVGLSYFESLLEMSAMGPDAEGWEAGDRTLLCLAWRPGSGRLVGTVRDTAM